MKNWIKMILLVALSQSAGLIGALLMSDMSWYQSLIKPSFTPPGWLFGPVWVTLYLLMGISAYFVWENKTARYLFLGQLALNALWTPVFFGAHYIFLALVILVSLLATVAVMTYKFYKINKTSAYLLIPYLLWLLLALSLNFGIYLLN